MITTITLLVAVCWIAYSTWTFNQKVNQLQQQINDLLDGQLVEKLNDEFKYADFEWNEFGPTDEDMIKDAACNDVCEDFDLEDDSIEKRLQIVETNMISLIQTIHEINVQVKDLTKIINEYNQTKL